MPFYRIFVEKKPAFRVEAESLRAELNENLQLSLPKLRLLNVYDLFGFSAELVAKSKYSVFGEVVTDDVTVAEGDAAAGFFREAGWPSNTSPASSTSGPHRLKPA